jgi:hypothetical protein
MAEPNERLGPHARYRGQVEAMDTGIAYNVKKLGRVRRQRLHSPAVACC